MGLQKKTRYCLFPMHKIRSLNRKNLLHGTVFLLGKHRHIPVHTHSTWALVGVASVWVALRDWACDFVGRVCCTESHCFRVPSGLTEACAYMMTIGLFCCSHLWCLFLAAWNSFVFSVFINHVCQYTTEMSHCCVAAGCHLLPVKPQQHGTAICLLLYSFS